MVLMTLHAICCNEDEFVNVQITFDDSDDKNFGDITLPMVRNEAYQQRMLDVCRDMHRFGYL